MALEVGSRLGHYDVTALIGEGGMGQVYRSARMLEGGRGGGQGGSLVIGGLLKPAIVQRPPSWRRWRRWPIFSSPPSDDRRS